MLSIDLVNDVDGFAGLKGQWGDALGSAEHNMFQTYEYVRTWWSVFGDGRNLTIAAVKARGEEKTVGILPFYAENRRGVNIAGIVGDRHSDYVHLVLGAVPREQPSVFAEFLSRWKGWDMIRVNGVVEGSNTERMLDGLNPGHFRATKTPLVKAPRAVFRGTWEDYYSGLDKRMRLDTERQRRRLKKMGDLRIVPIRGAMIGEDIETFFQMHSRRWAADGPKTLFSESLNREFYGQIARVFDEKGVLSFTKLMCGDQIVSMHLGFSYGGVFYYYIPAYNTDFFQYSVGRIHILELMRISREEGTEVFDFMAGEEAYKSVFANSSRQLNRWTVVPCSVKGRLLTYLEARRTKQ